MAKKNATNGRTSTSTIEATLGAQNLISDIAQARAAAQPAQAPAKAEEAPGRKKTVCPITREQFREQATDVTVTIDGKTFTADAREFATGSLGWYLNGKVQIKVGDRSVTVQVGMSLTVVGSKELPQS